MILSPIHFCSDRCPCALSLDLFVGSVSYLSYFVFLSACMVPATLLLRDKSRDKDYRLDGLEEHVGLISRPRTGYAS